MKASELRIGNLINYHGVIWTVEGIKNGVIYTNDEPFSLNMFQPIILTEEWLINFGFEKTLEIFKISRFMLRYRTDYKYWYICDTMSLTYLTKVEFVHEIQNFIFAMDGIELTLKQ